ncbi:MAG: four helix bundle protein [Flavobacteriales bacterium]|nr:four helix bundle protein [Bacteroidota bacterium]MCB9241530.1 four helix bundle protein [Flavobacteriales bacterium]
MKTHKDLSIWKESIELTLMIYDEVNLFELDDRITIGKELKRTVVSIPSNIAEGAARQSDKEFVKFLFYSLGSLSELETQLIIAGRQNILKRKHQLQDAVIRIRKMILTLIKKIKVRIEQT